MGVRIRGTLGDIDPLNKVPFKRATSREGSPLRGLPTTTKDYGNLIYMGFNLNYHNTILFTIDPY